MDPSSGPIGVDSRPTRTPRGWVVRDPSPQDVGATVDWSRWYVTDEDDMGESPEQNLILRLLLQCMEEWGRERAWKNVFIGMDAFFAWMPSEPLVRVSPDLYLLDDPPPPPLPRSWQTWRPGVKPPRFAVEVVSLDVTKDYEDAPERYAALGCGELVIFDPGASQSRSRTRAPVTVYRRDADGPLTKVYQGQGPAFSKELDAYLVVVDEGGRQRLRIARDDHGKDLVPSATEKAAELQARVAELEAKLAGKKPS
jgi:Uma2 family endonuclease